MHITNEKIKTKEVTFSPVSDAEESRFFNPELKYIMKKF